MKMQTNISQTMLCLYADLGTDLCTEALTWIGDANDQWSKLQDVQQTE